MSFGDYIETRSELEAEELERSNRVSDAGGNDRRAMQLWREAWTAAREQVRPAGRPGLADGNLTLSKGQERACRIHGHEDCAECKSFDPDELVRWAETYGHPEEWAQKAKAAHAANEVLRARIDELVRGRHAAVELYKDAKVRENDQRGQARYWRAEMQRELARAEGIENEKQGIVGELEAKEDALELAEKRREDAERLACWLPHAIL